MIESLSILIPTYNDICLELVTELHRQARQVALETGSLNYEIIVADDGSTQQEVKDANSRINSLSHCRLILCPENRGRAAIRNFLISEAQGEWLLFIDSDMGIDDIHYLRRYLEAAGNGTGDVVYYGGYCVGGNAKITINNATGNDTINNATGNNTAHNATGDTINNATGGEAYSTGNKPDSLRRNLRYVYEKRAEARHLPGQRAKHPYKDFHTSNFLVSAGVMRRYPLDSRFTQYGYEDVLWGKTLCRAGIKIRHIGNPLVFGTFEDNASFISKTEEGIATLVMFESELHGYNGIIAMGRRLRRLGLIHPVAMIHTMLGKSIKQRLIYNKPNIFLFNIYKLSLFCYLWEKSRR